MRLLLDFLILIFLQKKMFFISAKVSEITTTNNTLALKPSIFNTFFHNG